MTDRLRVLLKVIQARIRDNFGGPVLALIQWVDKIHSDTMRQACPGPTHRTRLLVCGATRQQQENCPI